MINWEDTVYTLLADFRHIPARDPSLLLREDLGFDETDLILLIMATEDAFKTTIPERDAAPSGLKRVGDVLRLVRQYGK